MLLVYTRCLLRELRADWGASRRTSHDAWSEMRDVLRIFKSFCNNKNKNKNNKHIIQNNRNHFLLVVSILSVFMLFIRIKCITLYLIFITITYYI